MRLYSPDITKPTEVNYYWHEKVLIEPMPKPKQGEWIVHFDDLFPEESTEECSVCHAEQIITGNDNNFCPHCGAKMEGVDDEQGNTD